MFKNVRLLKNNLIAKLNRKLAESGFGGSVIQGQTELCVQHIRKGQVIGEHTVYDKLITEDFVEDVVEALKGNTINTFDNYIYHGSGTSSVGEDETDSELGDEVMSRISGTSETGENDNTYKSVATVVYDDSYAISEHGLFNAETNGVLMDRTVFPDINVQEDDAIQFTFTITFQSGGA